MVISLAPLLLLVVFPGVLCWALAIYNANEMPSVVSSPVLMFAEDMKIFHVIRNGNDNTILYRMTWIYFTDGHNSGK